MIGICGLKPAKLDDEPSEKIEIMYRLAQPYWGNGYATEAGKILLEYAFNKLKLSQVIGFILPENNSSRAVLRRLGMKFIRKSTYSGHKIDLFEIHAKEFIS
jgi:RimJ/RimL family protein N-acetyltransferase